VNAAYRSSPGPPGPARARPDSKPLCYRSSMAFTTLIGTLALSELLHDPRIVLVDCRYSLDDSGWGRAEYRRSHIPGAVFADMDHDLSGPKTGSNGRHPLPDVAALAATLSGWGIASDVQVVAYDQDAGMYASRLWWLLRWVGHDAVAVLDGGFAKWQAEGRPTISGDERAAAPRSFEPRPRPGMAASVDTIASLIDRRDWKLVDARAPERFRGEVEPVDPTPGHIPGAVNHPYRSNVTAAGAFRPAIDLRSHLLATLGDVPANQTICYCGSGVTACQVLLALEHVGLTGARLYPGSWSEWVSDRERPVATGSDSVGGG
jgi:thiosulfate/3-mercaptopyruvate sulfurtransferase